MRIGMVGLGRMGAGMTRRLLRGGHQVVVHDLDPAAVAAIAAEGAEPADSLGDLVAALPAPRAVWMMLPAGEITSDALRDLGGLCDAGDVVVDGGNSRPSDTVERAAALAAHEVHLVDAGTSGGVWGLEEGYCLMVGGDAEAIARLEPLFADLAPPDGYAHVGGPGAGHYTKMVHNGVEYALMQAYAEGFDLLEGGPFNVDPRQVAEVWRHGSVVRSWLLDLSVRALDEDPDLERLVGRVDDSGEGRWTVQAGIDHAIPTPAMAAALYARFDSRRTDTFGNRLLAALRNQFGGHPVPARPPGLRAHAIHQREDGS